LKTGEMMSSNQIPTSVKELSLLEHDIFERLISRYQSDGNCFIDDDTPQTGLIYACAGAVAVLLLVNTFDDLAADSRWQNIVVAEFDRVHKHVEQKSYDATPFVTERITEKLFSKSANYYYTDSLSWVLSLTTQIRVAAYRKNILNPGPGFMDRVHNLMKDALEKICEAACPQGGWNFANGCSAPHLYYSFAVTEALADFGDYVLGETPQIFGKNSKEAAEDSDLLKLLTGPLVERVNAKRKLTLEYLFNTYLPRLGETEIEPIEVPGATVPHKHLLLYYSYFVIEMLVTCNLPEFHREWADEIDDATENGIYLSRIDLHRAINDETTLTEGGRTWFADPEQSTLSLKDWSLFKEPGLIPVGKLSKLAEPGLIPLAVRCNAQYAYYVAKGKDSKMGKLFALLLGDRNDDNGLWDKASYSLLITERAIEAIVDYYDYLNQYEGGSGASEVAEANQSKIDAAFREILKDEVQAYVAKLGNLPAPPNPAPAESGLPLNEETLIKKLNSALATANSYAKGNDGEGLPVAKIEIERFQDNFRVFLTNLLIESLGDVHPEEKTKLRAGVAANMQDLWVNLAPWIAADQKLKLGNLFSHLADETLKSVETGRGGARGNQK